MGPGITKVARADSAWLPRESATKMSLLDVIISVPPGSGHSRVTPHITRRSATSHGCTGPVAAGLVSARGAPHLRAPGKSALRELHRAETSCRNPYVDRTAENTVLPEFWPGAANWKQGASRCNTGDTRAGGTARCDREAVPSPCRSPGALRGPAGRRRPTASA